MFYTGARIGLIASFSRPDDGIDPGSTGSRLASRFEHLHSTGRTASSSASSCTGSLFLALAPPRCASGVLACALGSFADLAV